MSTGRSPRTRADALRTGNVQSGWQIPAEDAFGQGAGAFLPARWFTNSCEDVQLCFPHPAS